LEKDCKSINNIDIKQGFFSLIHQKMHFFLTNSVPNSETAVNSAFP
jgi:hypothetical protein